MKNKQVNRLLPVTRIEEVDSARLSMAIIVTIVLFIVAAVVWAAFTQIDEVVVTNGEVMPVSKIYTIQHLEGGEIQNILVKEGEEVQAGQVLVVFDPTVPKLELQQIRARNAAIINSGQELQKLLDISQQNLSNKIEGSPELNQYSGIHTTPTQPESTEKETAKAEPRKVNPIENQYLTVTAFKQEAEADIAQFDTLLEILTKRLTIMLQEKDMYEKLIDKGVISKKDYLELLRVITQVEEEINKAKAAHLETQYSISKLEQRLNNIEVKAPVHGLVKGLQAHISNIIQPGGYLMDIVPVENLIVESRLKSSDVGLVRIGDKVHVKIDTYDYTRFGEIQGTLVKISATTFLENPSNPSSLSSSGAAPGTPTNNQGTSAFYKASIQLDKTYVGDNPNNNKLLPGMTVIADIHVGTKSLLKYLLKPVHAAIETSFREQ